MQKLRRFAHKGVRILLQRLQTQGLRTTLVWVYGRGWPKLTGVPLAKYSQITDQLYVGGQFNRRGERTLTTWGVRGVVNLREEYDDAACGLTLPAYCYLPTVDDAAPTLAHLDQGVAFIRQVTQAGGKVYIHCAGGVGRAPTMAAAYLVQNGFSLDDALRLIRRTRPFINLTPVQLARLQELEAREVERGRLAEGTQGG